MHRRRQGKQKHSQAIARRGLSNSAHTDSACRFGARCKPPRRRLARVRGGRTSPTSPAIHRPMVLCMHGRAQGVTKAAFVGKGRDLRGAVRRRFFEVRSGFMRFGLPAARVPSR